MSRFLKQSQIWFAMCVLLLIFGMQIIVQAQSYRAPETNPPHIISKSTVGSDKTPQTQKVLVAYSHGDPTVEEQYTLELINRARANPNAEGIRLVDTPDSDVQGAINFFSISKSLVKSQFSTYPSRPPLAFHPRLIECARGHSKDMRDNNFQSHSGSNGSTMTDRINKAAYTGWSGIGENVFSYAQSMWHAHAGFNIDWGADNQVTLGHRQNIMNYTGTLFTEIGVGVLEDNNPSTQVGRYIVTHNFGRRNDFYITGVAYKDNNNNGFYDMGEGLPNVKIELSKGTFFAVTSTSGGYAIPVTGLTGSVTVTATGTGLGGVVTKTVSLQGQNVKVDITSALPGMVSLILPQNEQTEVKKDIDFSWYKSLGATLYNFVLADNENFDSPILNIETTDTSRSVLGTLKNAKDYYWKVRAKTQAGWGDFSDPFMFQIRIYPKDCEIISPKDFEAIYRDTLSLTWKKNDPTAIRYWVQLAANEYFEEILFEDSNVVDTTKKIKVDYDMTYYWRVKSSNGDLWNEFTDPGIFYTVQVPAGIVPVSPANGFSTANRNIRFIWRKDYMDTEELKNNPFLPKGLYYWFELSEDKDFETFFRQDTLLRDTTVFIGNLKVGATYHWRAKAYHEMGYGPFGPVSTLTISSPSSVTDDLVKSGLTFSSVDGGAILSSQQQEFEVTTYTMEGRLLSTVKSNGNLFIPCDQSGMRYALVRIRNAHHMIPLQCIR
ncbi:MAG: CAP domain-containing protein [Candidatus Kapaibacteriota bacterium]